MKKNTFYCTAIIACALLLNLASSAQVAINTDGSAPNSASAMLDVKSTDKGILIPRVNGTGSITTPVQGLLIYNTYDDAFYYYADENWIKIASGSVGTWNSTSGGIYYNSGSVAIGASSINSKAILDIVSTTKGILIPRMTYAQRTAISTPTQGLIVYQTNSSGSFIAGIYFYNSSWNYLTNTSSGVLNVAQGGTGMNLANTGDVICGGGGSNAFSSSSSFNYDGAKLNFSGTFNLDGGLINKISTITEESTLDDTYNIVLCDGTFTIYLNDVSTNAGRVYTIKNIGSGTITINPYNSDMIEGASTYTLIANKSVVIVCNGSAWYITAGF
ncbi:MAG: hypothetical protein EHM93_11200 [Bacteroidales bacterium]|nr:MAG: hypothetical protein EHM93_11200 [Bacteroidales bacterium]